MSSDYKTINRCMQYWQVALGERPELYPSYLRWNGASFQEWVDRTRPIGAVGRLQQSGWQQGNGERDVDAHSPWLTLAGPFALRCLLGPVHD